MNLIKDLSGFLAFLASGHHHMQNFYRLFNTLHFFIVRITDF